MIDSFLLKAVGIALACGAVAGAATWVRRRQSVAAGQVNPPGLTPAGAGFTATIGALLGIAVFRWWPG